MRRLALCNEVIADREFAAQCVYAAELGYDALEVAPFTLGEDPLRLPVHRRNEVRRAASDAGIAISGLHWLLVKPEGLSLTTVDAAARDRTRDALVALVDLCAELGGRYLVHGSPKQRATPPGVDRSVATALIAEGLAHAAQAAERAALQYLIEPLPVDETDQINTLDEAVALVREIDSPALATMIDTKSVALAEAKSAAELVSQWLPTGLIRHVQLNDRNRRGPGQGSDRFAPVLAALVEGGYDGDIAIEPFDYRPDGSACAARAVGYVRGVLEGLAHRRSPDIH
ncbi:MAG TPA: sugar phosphate isomerase/epimerase family protein [Casimicrobiaceae bacterium]|nr:sugar phosphate isomerase/epimerase family protein [Casimicrobiaceae bacterium]